MAVIEYNPQNVPSYMGLAADTKPASAPAGSKFIETDTGKVFMLYNTGTWTQVALIPTTGWTEPAFIF